MSNDMLERLKAIDPRILTNVVRQDQNDPSFAITEWDVKRLSDKGIANPDGLWLFSGHGNGNDKSHSWSVVLKIVSRPQTEPAAKNLVDYWKREFFLFQSNIPTHISDSLKAPRIFHMEETPDGYRIWMEHITETQPVWTLDDYAFAAHQLGLWNGSYLTGTSLPAEDWLGQQHYRSWLGDADMEKSLQFPLNQKYITGNTRTRFEQLWQEKEIFFHALENLPQVFSHFDTTRRNLLLRSNTSGQRELVLLDWGQSGIGAIGIELNWLVAYSAALLEWSPAKIRQLEEVAFPSYVDGLRQSGWSGNTDLARLGYTAMVTVYLGCAFPDLIAFWCTPKNNAFALQQFNRVEEELYREWLPLIEYSVNCADEARALMLKLGYS